MNNIGIILLILVAACFGAMVFLWCVNSLAELGGSGFYIPHSVFSYFLALLLLVAVKAPTSGW